MLLNMIRVTDYTETMMVAAVIWKAHLHKHREFGTN